MTAKELLEYAITLGVENKPLTILYAGETKVLTSDLIQVIPYWDSKPDYLQIVVH